MVISPFSSLAGKTRSVTSAPQIGEACVLTDQEIEVRPLRELFSRLLAIRHVTQQLQPSDKEDFKHIIAHSSSGPPNSKL